MASAAAFDWLKYVLGIEPAVLGFLAAAAIPCLATISIGYRVALIALLAFPIVMGLRAALGADGYAAENRAKRARGERYGATSAGFLRAMGLLVVGVMTVLAVLLVAA
jgi:uncharacterized membrane protein YidH (DUF202 family)